MIFSAIVPIKANSQRLPGKNFKLLGDKPLFQHVLDTLSKIPAINQIIIDTDCPEKVEAYCKNKGSRFTLLNRPTYLLGDDIVMNELLVYNLDFAINEHIVQTHVTNPLLRPDSVIKAIELYQQGLSSYDSLFSVTQHQKRFYNQDGKPLNHDFSLMLPTQQLPPLFEENSNLFLFSKSSFKQNRNNRLGKTPQMFELPRLESIDIDEEEEFTLAQLLIKN
jgi:CMP-N-acetylneuraminic acid synthetase